MYATALLHVNSFHFLAGASRYFVARFDECPQCGVVAICAEQLTAYGGFDFSLGSCYEERALGEFGFWARGSIMVGSGNAYVNMVCGFGVERKGGVFFRGKWNYHLEIMRECSAYRSSVSPILMNQTSAVHFALCICGLPRPLYCLVSVGWSGTGASIAED